MRSLALALVIAVPAFWARAQTAGEGAEQDPIVAIVGGQEIHFSDVTAAQQRLPEQYRSAALSAIYPSMVERLIDRKLVVIAGRKANLGEDEEVKRRMALLEDDVIRDVYVNRHVRGIVTDEVLRQRYEEFAQTNPPKEEIKARHILLEAEEEARAVIEKIKGGADFAEVAKEKSIGPSAEAGGDLGYFTRDAMVPEFADAVFELQPGEISAAPVKTAYGWHVIKVEDRRPGAPPSFEEMRGQLASQMYQAALSELIEMLRANTAIERFELGGTPAPVAPPAPSVPAQ